MVIRQVRCKEAMSWIIARHQEACKHVLLLLLAKSLPEPRALPLSALFATSRLGALTLALIHCAKA